jgi:hypothetical protein
VPGIISTSDVEFLGKEFLGKEFLGKKFLDKEFLPAAELHGR